MSKERKKLKYLSQWEMLSTLTRVQTSCRVITSHFSQYDTLNPFHSAGCVCVKQLVKDEIFIEITCTSIKHHENISMRDKKIKKFTNKFSCKKAATNQKLLDTRKCSKWMGREWISFNSSSGISTEKKKMAMAQDILSQFVFCVLLCARLYTWTTRFQSVARKIVTFLFALPASAKIYFLQAQGRTPPIIFICSDKHQLLLLPLRIHEMKNEDMLTCRRRDNAVRWFSCENFRYIYTHSTQCMSLYHFRVFKRAKKSSHSSLISSQPSGKYKK